jgi:DivIVA domain-containing protein
MLASEMLTPKQIDDKRFTPTRFREGYDIDQVDQFCDQARDTISALADGAQEMKKDRDRWKRLAQSRARHMRARHK